MEKDETGKSRKYEEIPEFLEDWTFAHMRDSVCVFISPRTQNLLIFVL